MLQEGNLTNPTGTGIVRSKQSQHQRKSQTGPQMGDKEPKCKTEPPNRPPRCGNTTPCLRSGESFAPQPRSEGLASTRARRRESAGDSAQPQQRSAPAALPPCRPPPPPLPREGGDRAGALPGSAAIHAAGTPAFLAARHGATRDPFRGLQLLEPPLKWNRGRPGANPSAPRGCGGRRAPPLSGPWENPQCRAAVAAPGSARPLCSPGARGPEPGAARPHLPAPLTPQRPQRRRAPRSLLARAAPPLTKTRPIGRDAGPSLSKDAADWARRRRGRHAARGPCWLFGGAALGQSERAGGGRAGPRARARRARDAGRGGAAGDGACPRP